MSAAETLLEMLRRHVRQGTEHVAGQRALITRLRERGLPTDAAEALLVTFEEIQRQHEAHLAEVEAGEPRPGTPAG